MIHTLEPPVRREIRLIGTHHYAAQIVPKQQISAETLVHFIRTAAAAGDIANRDVLANRLLRWSRSVLAREAIEIDNAVIREEVIADTLIDAYTKISAVSDNDFWGIHYWTCLHRLWNHNLGKVIRRNRVSDTDDIAGECFNEAHVASTHKPVPASTYAEIESALSTLTARERAVFMAFYYQGYTRLEIATRIDVSESLIRNILRSARQKLAVWREAV